MKKQQISDRITEVGIVPVVRASSAEQAVIAVEAIYAGGIPVVEITMTVPGAVEVIRGLVKSKSLGAQVLVGAGTVLDANTARLCIDAGASFIVSPGLDLATVEFTVAADTLIIAGALSPTEVITAWKAGADFVKVFPCGQVGGADYIRALRGPLPHIPLIPTGGVNLRTAAAFISAGAAALGVGGELVQPDALRSRRVEIITENARNFLAEINKARRRLAQPAAAAVPTAACKG